MRQALLYAALLLGSSFAAQAESFTYRGQLEDGGMPAQGLYQLKLSLYADAHGKQLLAAPILLDAVPVNDGRFAVGADFPDLPSLAQQGWMEVAVKGEGDSDFWPLPGRQAVSLKAQLCPESWALGGNASTNAGVNFLGTTDTQPLVLRTANAQSLRLEPSTQVFNGLPITANLIAGSHANSVTAGVRGATIAGGGLPSGASDPDFLSEGPNRVTDAFGSVGGGYANVAGDDAGSVVAQAYATVAGGRSNRAGGLGSVVGGGAEHIASGPWSVVAGGLENRAISTATTVSGGESNLSSAAFGSVAGGFANSASGQYSAVGGGLENCAGAAYSWAGGRRAKVRPGSFSGLAGSGCAALPLSGTEGDRGSFVWADSQDADFLSTGPDQFLVRAAGGMAVNSSTPLASLSVGGADKWNPEIGNGWGDFSVGTSSFGLAVGVAQGGGGAGTARIWAKGGTEDLIFTSAGNPSVASLFLTGSGRAGVRRAPSANAFEVEGNASKSTAGSWLANSDARIKVDVQSIEGALERLMLIRPVRFRYSAEYLARHPDIEDEIYYNVLAQEFARVFPESVKGSGEYLNSLDKSVESEILQVDVHPAVMTTIAAVQEITLQFEAERQAFTQEIAELRARLAKLERTPPPARDLPASDHADDVASLRAELAELRSLLLGKQTQER